MSLHNKGNNIIHPLSINIIKMLKDIFVLFLFYIKILFNFFLLYIILMFIIYHTKSKTKYSGSKIEIRFLQKSFLSLIGIGKNDCKYHKRLSCVGFKSNNICNIFYFQSKAIRIRVKQSPYIIIKSINKKLNMKKINNSYVYHHYKLKLFGFKDVILSNEGTVHSSFWDLTISGGCKCLYIPNISLDISIYKFYDKVITISHHWGNAVFHSIVECLTKLGYYIPELLRDDSIKIHTMNSASLRYLNFLGFNNSRIVYGNIYVKKLLVLEKGGCGSTPPLVHLYYLRYYLIKKIAGKRLYDIIVIKRYGIRDIHNFDEVLFTLKHKYITKRIAVFYPNTSFVNTLNYFKYAKLIVAPHGAGLSNIIVSNIAIIVEFLYVNLCYTGLASKLGLEYYGIYENITNNKFNVNISMLNILLSQIII